MEGVLVSEYSDKQKQMLEDIKGYISKYGVPKSADFNSKNGLHSCNYYKKVFNKEHLKDILELVDIEMSEKYKVMHYSKNKELSEDELLAILRKYNDEVDFPTSRAFTAKNNLPNAKMYYNRFGSFKNAILLAGIKIPENKKWLYEREEWSKEDIKVKIKDYVDNIINSGGKLPTNEEIDMEKSLPSTAVITRRFGGLLNLYKEIGYDLNHNDNMLKEKLLREYKELAEEIDKTPTSRDLDEYSLLGKCHSASAYARHFGGIHNLQLKSGYTPTDIGRNKTKEELIADVIDLSKRLKRVPQQKDFINKNSVASIGVYKNEFGSMYNALKLAGFSDDEIGYKTYETKGGLVCLSLYEYKFATMLEDNDFDFEYEAMYREYISNFDKGYRFDFIVTRNGRYYFVEIFGIEGNEKYNKRVREKIKICSINNIPLIDLYPDLFWSTTEDGLLQYFEKEIGRINNAYYSS